MKDKLKRIGVFYDGNYFFRVSSYYAYGHERKSRLSISGIHHFIEQQVAKAEDSDPKLCKIVDAHYFRGRLSAAEANQRGDTLYWDRVFDDILMSEGVVTHYLPVIKDVVNGEKDRHREKGIDVLLAVEALETAFYKNFDVLVLIASDGDYVPLIRKLHTLGTRVMLLSWDFEYTDDMNKRFTTRTSQDLLEEVSYPIHMHEIINNRLTKNEAWVSDMFVQSERRRPQPIKPIEVVEEYEYTTTYSPAVENVTQVQIVVTPAQTVITPAQTVITPAQTVVTPAQTVVTPAQTVVTPAQTVVTEDLTTIIPVQNTATPVQNIVLPTDLNKVADVSNIIQPFVNNNQLYRGEVLSLKNGFGFIKFPPNNLFFHYSDVKGLDFNELQPGDKVEFVTGVKDNGQGYATNIKLI